MPSQGNPMALQRHLWYTALVLINSECPDNLANIFYVMSYPMSMSFKSTVSIYRKIRG